MHNTHGGECCANTLHQILSNRKGSYIATPDIALWPQHCRILPVKEIVLTYVYFLVNKCVIRTPSCLKKTRPNNDIEIEKGVLALQYWYL